MRNNYSAECNLIREYGPRDWSTVETIVYYTRIPHAEMGNTRQTEAMWSAQTNNFSYIQQESVSRTGFSISKNYQGCIDKDGNAFIGYWVSLHWGNLP